MSNTCRPIFPATAYTGDDEIATALAGHNRPHSSEYESGMTATDLILLNSLPSYTSPKETKDFLEWRGDHGAEASPEDWGPGDESIVKELAIASYMVPEILHDDDYDWNELYDATPGIPFHTTQGERDLREQITKVHFPSEQEIDNLFSITDENIRCGEWVLVSAEGTYDRPVGVFGRENEEWAECLELSYFAEYDQSTDEEYFIVDNKGHPALHNAERHEQRCALNALWNHPAQDSMVESTYGLLHGDGFTRVQEVVEKPNVLDECGIHGVECQLIATGDNFAAAICRYGGVFVPRKCQSLISDGGDFTARLTISTEGAKYPLRVAEINRC